MIPQDHHEENYSNRTTQIIIPRVLPNQRHRFETEDFFRKSAQTSEVMYQSNIASVASYVYILSGQKLIKNARNGQFDEFLKTLSLRSNSVTRQVSFYRTKICVKCQN